MPWGIECSRCGETYEGGFVFTDGEVVDGKNVCNRCLGKPPAWTPNVGGAKKAYQQAVRDAKRAMREGQK